MTYPDICYVMQCSGKSCPRQALHASCQSYHCLFLLNRKNAFLQIMIRAGDAEIKQKDSLITLKYIPVSMKIVFFMGVK